MKYAHCPGRISVEMIDRLTEMLAFDLAGPNWAMYGVGAECRRQAVFILACIEQWVPVGVEKRDGDRYPEQRYVGA